MANVEPKAIRTFDRLEYTLTNLRDASAELERMIDRISPVPTDDEVCDHGPLGCSPPYATTLDNIQHEVERIGGLISDLSRHI